MWIEIQFWIGSCRREFASYLNRQLELSGCVLEICVFLQQRLGKIIRAIGELLEGLDALFPGQFLLLVTQCKADKFDLPLFLAFELGLVRFIILLHIVIGNFDLFVEISRTQPNESHRQRIVSPFVICLDLCFRYRDAGRQKLLDLLQRKLVAN